MTARQWADIALHTALALLGIVGLATGFDDLGWLLAGVGGLLVGTSAALVARALRFGPLLTVALALAGYLLFGSAFAVPEQAVAGVVPTARSLESLVVGAVWGWADLVTLAAPVDLPDHVTVVPYVASWLVGLVGTTLAVRWLPRRGGAWRAAVLLPGPLALYLASILLGTSEPFLPGARGVVFACVALIGLGWRRAVTDDVEVMRSPGMLRRRLVGGTAVVAAAATVGALTGAALAPPPDTRFVLRERIEPPLVPLEFPSPLAGFRQFTKLLEDEVLFTVDGLPADQRLRLATMDAYDGHIWTVAGATTTAGGSGGFSLVGAELPAPPLLTPADPVALAIEVGDYADVWIPTVGYATSLSLPTATRDELEGLRYNPATGGVVLQDGLEAGDRIVLVAVPQAAAPDDDALRDVPTATVELAPVAVIPDVVAARAAEITAGQTSPIAQLRAIEQTLQTTGYLSHGSASDAAPSLAGHGADRMSDLFTTEPMVGDEEQYASAFALMARSLGYPARIVLGFAPETTGAAGGPVEVRGGDVTAWVEVAFDGVGWLPFSPTPEQTDVPQDQVPEPQSEPQPQVRQPPRSQLEQDDLVTAVEIEDPDADDDGLAALPAWVGVVAVAIAVPTLLLLLPALVVAALKARRAHRRRTAAARHDAVAGAWDEALDRLLELGYATPGRATRVVAARELEHAGADGLVAVARRADTAVFAGLDVSDAEVADAWADAERVVAAGSAGVSRRRRLASRYRLGAVRRWWRALAERLGVG